MRYHHFCKDENSIVTQMKKLQKLDEFKKYAILKKGIGIESQIYANNLTIKKLYKQDGTQLLL